MGTETKPMCFFDKVVWEVKDESKVVTEVDTKQCFSRTVRTEIAKLLDEEWEG